MSFILDAIARSERERQQRETPGLPNLATPVTVDDLPRRRNTIYIVTGILLLNAVVLTVWMQTSHQPAEPAPGNPVPRASTSQSKPTVNSGLIVREPQAVPPAPTVTAPAAAQPQVESPTEVKTTETVVRAAPAPTPPPAPALEREQPVDPSDEENWIRIGPETLVSRTQNESVRQTPTGGIRVRSTSELPDSVRQALPTVVFSGHLYSSEEGSSLVFVEGGRPITPGQRIVDDVYLSEITAKGVVVEFRGYLISIGVLQNWTLN